MGFPSCVYPFVCEQELCFYFLGDKMVFFKIILIDLNIILVLVSLEADSIARREKM